MMYLGKHWLLYPNKTVLELEIYRRKDLKKKSRIRETKNLSTDADSRTDTILERMRDLS